jgi:hypothetical protein
MEQYIGFAIMLFLLSMICERLADFLKNFIGQQNSKAAVGVKKALFMGNTVDKGLPGSISEDRRYYRILKINILCGFATAIAMHADLFTILSNLEQPESTLTWEKYDVSWWLIFPLSVISDTGVEQSFLRFLLGCLLTGLFISFGSKFWHDLLDLLLEVKNLKRKVTDRRTYALPETVEDLEAFIQAPESRLAMSADDLHHDSISKMPGVVSVGPGYMDLPSGRIGCLEVHFNDEKAMLSVPATVKINVGKMSVPVPVNKFLTGNATIHAEIFGAGIMAANQSKVNGWGSLGCVVKKKGNATDRYILSCYHVLSSIKTLTGAEVTREVIIKQKDKEGIQEDNVAVFEEGMRTETLDAAIAKITNLPGRFTNRIVSSPKKIRNVTISDAKDQTPVRIFSSKRKLEIPGIVFNDSWKQSFKYPDRDYELKDLIVLTRKLGNNTRSMTEKGDSGSLVVDANNEAIGIVVGGDDCFTYAIKMTTIEKQFDIELI